MGVVSSTITDWLPEGGKVLTYNRVCAPPPGGPCDAATVTVGLTLALSFFGHIDAGCTNGAAALSSLTDICVQCVVPPLFQVLQFCVRCLFGILLQLHFGLLFPERKESFAGFRSLSRLVYPSDASFSSKGFQLGMLWLVIRLRAVSFNNRHAEGQGKRTKGISDSSRRCPRRMQRMRSHWPSFSNLSPGDVWTVPSSSQARIFAWPSCSREVESMLFQSAGTSLRDLGFFYYHGRFWASCYFAFLLMVSNHSGG